MKKTTAEATFRYMGRAWQVELLEIKERSKSTMHFDYESFIPRPFDSDDDSTWKTWRRAENAMMKPVADWAVEQINAMAPNVSRFKTFGQDPVVEPQWNIVKATWSGKAGCSCGCSPGFNLKGMPKGYMISVIDVAHVEAVRLKAEERKAEQAEAELMAVGRS